jgi:hypothetical protein
LQLDIPVWVTDDQIRQANLLDVNISADPGRDLEDFILENSVDLPMLSVLTPLPGTDIYGRMKDDISITDLDYYTLTNAVIPTKMNEEEFYSRFAGMVSSFHANGKV